MSQLGEAGGPQWYRQLTMGGYNLKQNMGFLLKGVQATADGKAPILSNIPGLAGGAAAVAQRILKSSSVENSMKFINAHPEVSYAAMTGMSGAVGHIDDWLDTAKTIGYSLGFGAGGGAPGIAGFDNPFAAFGSAGSVGMGFAAEKNLLMGRFLNSPLGGNLTGDQATSLLDVLGNQGFSMNGQVNPWAGHPTGDAATIANGFASLMTQMPGLSAGELGHFTPSLRNANGNIQQLTDTLHNLGLEAQAAKEGVNQYTQSVADSAQTMTSMGANSGAATQFSTGFTNITGLDPKVAATLAQSPMIQGAMLGQGILPSGIGNMSASTFVGGSTDLIKMMAKGLSGLGHTTYQTIGGHRYVLQNGSAMVDSQIAQMLGIPETVVARLLGDAGPISARAKAAQQLGNDEPGSMSGLFGAFDKDYRNDTQIEKMMGRPITGLSSQDRDQLIHDWNAMTPTLRKAGFTNAQIQSLDKDKNLRSRLRDAQTILLQKSKDDKFNQIRGEIGLTPNASQYFNLHWRGPSVTKQMAMSAQGPALTEAINSGAVGMADGKQHNHLDPGHPLEGSVPTREWNSMRADFAENRQRDSGH